MLTAVPLLKEVKVNVLPLMLPAEAVREAVKVVAVPVLPLSPSAASALPVPEIDRSELVPVLICSAPLAATDDAVAPVAVVSVAVPALLLAAFVPVARSMALSTSVMVPA